MPLTIGSSGPTKTIDIFFSTTTFLIRSKSFTSPSMFVAKSEVPPFPGRA